MIPHYLNLTPTEQKNLQNALNDLQAKQPKLKTSEYTKSRSKSGVRWIHYGSQTDQWRASYYHLGTKYVVGQGYDTKEIAILAQKKAIESAGLDYYEVMNAGVK